MGRGVSTTSSENTSSTPRRGTTEGHTMTPEKHPEKGCRQGARRRTPTARGNGVDTRREASHAARRLVNVCGTPTSHGAPGAAVGGRMSRVAGVLRAGRDPRTVYAPPVGCGVTRPRGA